MGRHSRDDDPAPRLPERPQDSRRPQNQVGPPTPLRYGPRSQAPARSAQPQLNRVPVAASQHGDDRTRILPAPIDSPAPDQRTATGLRGPADGFQPSPRDDSTNANRTTIGLRRPAANPDRPTSSGAYRAVRDDRPATEGRSTTAGAYPIVSDDGSAGFQPVPEGRATSTGGHPAVPTSTGGYPAVPEGRSSSSGGFQAFGETGATSTGGFRPVPDGRATSTGSFRPVPDGRATSTGGFRTSEGRATSTGGFRITNEGRATYTGGHRPVGEGRSTSTGGFRTTSTGSHRTIGKSTSTGGHRIVDDERSTSTGGHRTVTEGRSTATGTHRAMGKIAGRRRIAKWPIFAGAFVVLLVVGLLGWGWANNVLNSRAEAQANACTDGDSTLTVVVAPTAQQPVSAAAARWNQAKTVVHAHCVHVDVRAIPSQQVLDALTGKADLTTIGGLPAAWIPENSSWIDQLQTTKPGIVGSPAESVASAPSANYPFLGLAGDTVDEVQARAAQVFRDYLREPAQQADFTSAGLGG